MAKYMAATTATQNHVEKDDRWMQDYRFLKCPYYGFLKMTFHAVCNTALSEWKHPAKF